MRIKIIILLIAIFIGNNLFAQGNSDDFTQHEGNIVTMLEVVYEMICDYGFVEFPQLTQNRSIGRIIQIRMAMIMSVLIFINLMFNALKVIGDPREDFTKYMFLKPAFLFIFISFYPYAMGKVNDLLEYATFRDVATETVTLTRMNIQNVYENTTIMLPSGAMSMSRKTGSEVSFSEHEENIIDVMRDPEKIQQMQLMDKIIEARKNGIELSDEDKRKIAELAQAEIEGKGAVKGFQSLIYWGSDKVSIVMRIIQTVLLCVFFVGGPIAIACESIFPGSLKKWFGIFIHTHLWTPVIFLIDMVAILINQQLAKLDYGGAGTIVTLVVQIVIIALYIIIAKMASNFIQSQEGGGVLGAMSYKTLQHVQMGAKRMMGGAGGAAGAASGAIKGNT